MTNDFTSQLRGYLDTGEWRTKDQCVGWLNGIFHLDISERTFRIYVAEFNKRYEDGDTEMFIAHSNKGYLMTADEEIIMDSLKDDYKRAVALMKRYWGCKKAQSMKDQIKLTPEEINTYEVVMKMS